MPFVRLLHAVSFVLLWFGGVCANSLAEESVPDPVAELCERGVSFAAGEHKDVEKALQLMLHAAEQGSAECARQLKLARRRKKNRQYAKRSRLRRLSGDTTHDEQVRAARLSGKIEALQAANQVLRHKHMMQTG